MLKVKDNIDLEELEKFGFIRLIKLFGDRYQKSVQGGYINIEEIGREIEVYVDVADFHFGVPIDCWDTIYDLIKADMVEKVVEDEK